MLTAAIIFSQRRAKKLADPQLATKHDPV